MPYPQPDSFLEPVMQLRIAYSVSNKLRKEYREHYRDAKEPEEVLKDFQTYIEFKTECQAFWDCYKTFTRWKKKEIPEEEENEENNAND